MKVLHAARQTNLFEQFANPQFEPSEDYRIIDKILNNETIIKELSKDFPDTDSGRKRTAIEQTLRFLVLKHQKNFNYRDLARTLQVNLEDRWFCKITGEGPCFKTLQNQISCIKEDTVKKINERVMQEAKKLKITKGKKMRVDSTVTEANIHYPTDSSLIVDGIRSITKKIKQLKTIPKGFRTFKRKIKQQINIIRTIGRKNKEVRDKATKELIKIAKNITNKIRKIKKKKIKESKAILEKIIKQTEKVLNGEKAKNRIVSIYEPTVRPITKGKVNRKCEFGKVVQIQEDEALITEWEISNKPNDNQYFKTAIKKHERIHGKAPTEVATDRGYYSKDNIEYATKKGAKHVSIPKKGRPCKNKKTEKKTYKFKELQKWRAGGEAKISLLKRKYGLDRCKYKHDKGMALWVSAGILSCNLMTMAKQLTS